MEVDSYKFHRRARMSFYQLDADEQAQVLETVAGLVQTPIAQWPISSWQAKRLPGEPPMYLVRVNNSLRAIVSAAEGQEPEVMDFVRRETLELFAKSNGSSEH
jgi:hypothetical protein